MLILKREKISPLLLRRDTFSPKEKKEGREKSFGFERKERKKKKEKIILEGERKRERERERERRGRRRTPSHLDPSAKDRSGTNPTRIGEHLLRNPR